MKTLKLTSYLSGFLLICLIMGCEGCAPEPPQAGGPSTWSQTTVVEANRDFDRYFANPTQVTGGFQGVYISQDQLDALNQLKTHDTNTTGYRIYCGLDASGNAVSLAVAVNSSGDDVTNYILSSPSEDFSPCPPTCDYNSGITNPK